MDNKIDAFEYLVYQLQMWHEKESESNQNDLSVLKVLKLLFFVSAVDTKQDSENTLLDKVFTNFVAMPYGHVESDVYTNIKQKAHANIYINNTSSTIRKSFEIDNIDIDIRNSIDTSLTKIKKINPNIIKYSSFDLVDLSHTWYSWQYFYKEAVSEGVYSKSIPVDEIKSEEKIYQL